MRRFSFKNLLLSFTLLIGLSVVAADVVVDDSGDLRMGSDTNVDLDRNNISSVNEITLASPDLNPSVTHGHLRNRVDSNLGSVVELANGGGPIYLGLANLNYDQKVIASGNIDLTGHSLVGVGGTQCSTGEFLDGSGNCVEPSGGGSGGTDDQQLQGFTRSGQEVTLELENGGSATFTDQDTVIADTNAGTECSSGQYLDGDGTCKSASSGGDGYLPEDPATSTVNMNDNNIDNVAEIEGSGDTSPTMDLKGWVTISHPSYSSAVDPPLRVVDGMQFGDPVGPQIESMDNGELRLSSASGMVMGVQGSDNFGNLSIRGDFRMWPDSSVSPGGSLYTNSRDTGSGKITDLTVTGDLTVNGQVNGNSKNFIQSINDTHEAVYTSQESPEARAVFEGTETMEGGETVVTLPDHFSKVVSDEEAGIKVQATPRSLATLAVVERSSEEIKVVSDKKESLKFDYRVTGVREGFENKDVVRRKVKE